MAKPVTIICGPIIAELVYVDAHPPPDMEIDWADVRDYPGVRCDARVPTEYVYAPLRYEGWGVSTRGTRAKSKVFRAPTLAAAEAHAHAWVSDQAAAVQAVIDQRHSRLAKRAATIAAANAAHGKVTPPADLKEMTE